MFSGDGQGRHKPQDIAISAARHHDDTAIEQAEDDLTNCIRIKRFSGLLVFYKLNTDHETPAAHVADDARLMGTLMKSGFYLLADLGGALN